MATGKYYRIIYLALNREDSGSVDYDTYAEAEEHWNRLAKSKKYTSLEIQSVTTETLMDWYKQADDQEETSHATN